MMPGPDSVGSQEPYSQLLLQSSMNTTASSVLFIGPTNPTA
jgi:hypothetical protein